RDPELLEVVDALGAAGGLARRLHGRHQQRDQHGDDGDDDQQLDQRETTSAPKVHGEAPRLPATRANTLTTAASARAPDDGRDRMKTKPEQSSGRSASEQTACANDQEKKL